MGSKVYTQVNQVEVRDVIIKLLKTIPEIKTCSISIRPYGLYLQEINQTKLTISDQLNMDTNSIVDSLLMEANIKQNTMVLITKQLDHLYINYSNGFTIRSKYTQIFNTLYKAEI